MDCNSMKRFLFTWCGGLGLAASLAASEVPRIMQLAIIREDLALLEQCLASGLPVDGVDDSDPPQNKEEVQPNSLMLAIAWKKPEAVQWLLDRGADRHVRSSPNHGLIELALSAGSPAICEMLRAPLERPEKHKIQHGLHRNIWSSFKDILPDAPRWFVRVNGEDGAERLIQSDDLPWSVMEVVEPKEVELDGKHWKLSCRDRSGKVWGASADITTEKVSDTEWKVSAVISGTGVNEKSVDHTVRQSAVSLQTKFTHGSWIVLDPAFPEWAVPEPAPVVGDVGRFLESDGSSLDGAVCDDNPAWMRLLITTGMNPLRLPESKDDSLSCSILENTAVHNKPRVAKAIIEGCRDALYSSAAQKAFEHAYEHGNTELVELLALDGTEDPIVDAFPSRAIHYLFSETWRDSRFKVAFVSLNGADPAADVMKVIRKALPIAEPWSVVEEGAFTSSSYRHMKTKEEGWGIEATLWPAENGCYGYRFRQMTGPALAGGGSEGLLVKSHGRWVKTKTKHWDE